MALTFVFSACSDNSPTSPTPPDKPASKLSKPSLISPQDKAKNKANTTFFQWKTVQKAASYELQIAPSSDFSNPVITKSNLQVTYYKATGLQQNTDYYWRVRAKNGSGNSPWSSVWILHVNQEIQLADKTKLLPNKVADMISDTTMHLAKITFTGSGKFLQSLKKGNILLGQGSDALPHGALRKITQISRSGNTVTIQTTQASLVEAFKQANIHFEVPLKPRQTKSGKANLKSTAPVPAETANLGTFSKPIDNVILYDADGNKTETTNDQIRLNGNISFTPTLEGTIIVKKFAGIPTGLKKFGFIVHSDFNSDINVTSGISYGIGKKVRVLRLPAGEIQAGFVPIFPVIELYVGISGKVSAGLMTGVNYKFGTDAGLVYSNKDWSTVSDYHQKIDYKPVQAKLKASAKAYGEVDVNAFIADVAGPHLDFQGYLRADVEPLKDPWWSLYWGLAAGAGIKVEILSHTLANFEKPDIISQEHLIAKADGAKEKPKLSFTPSSFTFSAKASTSTLSIKNAGSGALQWKVTSDVDWLSLQPSSGTGKADVEVKAAQNTSGQQRKANINITSSGGDSDPIPVTQKAYSNNQQDTSKKDFIYASSAQTKLFTSAPSNLYTVEISPGGQDYSIGQIKTEQGEEPVITDITKGESGEIWGVSYNELYQIDEKTAIAQRIGDTGFNLLNALEIDSARNLIAMTINGNLVQLNKETGRGKFISELQNEWGSAGDLAFGPNDVLYGIVEKDSGQDYLATIDIDSGKVTLVNSESKIGFNNVFGLTFFNNTFYGLTTTINPDGGYLLEIDSTTGIGSMIRPLNFQATGAGKANLKIKESD